MVGQVSGYTFDPALDEIVVNREAATIRDRTGATLVSVGDAIAGQIFPADAAGALTNNGAGVLSWSAAAGGATVPVGSIISYAGAAAPADFLLCDGSAFSAAVYPDLNTLLGGNTLPDLRGQFLRGLDSGAGIDPDVRTLLSTQVDALGDHIHRIFQSAIFQAAGGTNAARGSIALDGVSFNPSTTSGARDTGDAAHLAGPETRPVNVAVNFIIRATA